MVEVQEDLDELKEVVLRKLKRIFAKLGVLKESVQLLENDREEYWEAVSQTVSTMVGDSVVSLTERLTELEQTVRSQGTTPVTDDDVLNMETWSTMEQAIWSELGKLREHAQEVPNLYTLCEKLYESQKTQDKQITGLRGFARQVEQFLGQMSKGKGATAPKGPRETPALDFHCMCKLLNPQGRIRLHMDLVRAVLHSLALYEVRFDLVQFGLISLTLNNGQLEMRQSSGTKKQRRCGI